MPSRKVLIVEDEADICGFMKAMLESRGVQVFVALKAEGAWELFQKEKPQACSLDLHLSYSAFDGIELLKKIKQLDKNTFCLIFTRIEDEDKVEHLKQLGADAIFFKPPASDEELRHMVDLLAANKPKGVANG